MADFINGSNRLSDFAEPPYTLSGFDWVGFPIPLGGDPTRLQAICDANLNVPLNAPADSPIFVPTFRDRALGEVNGGQVYDLWISFARFPRCTSAALAGFGVPEFVSYQEVSVSFFVEDTRDGLVYQYFHVLFIDGPDTGRPGEADNGPDEHYAINPIVIGRELYGLPKMRGQIVFDAERLTGSCKLPHRTSEVPLIEVKDGAEVVTVRRRDVRALALNAPEDESRRIAMLSAQTRAEEAYRRTLDAPRPAAYWGRPADRILLAQSILGSDRVTRILAERRALEEPSVRSRIDAANGAVERARTSAAAATYEAREQGRTTAETELAAALPDGDPLRARTIEAMRDFGADAHHPVLLGLRQLHDVTNFSAAKHQEVIASPFNFNAAQAMHPGVDYAVTIGDDVLAAPFGLTAGQPYIADGDRIWFLNGADGDYGDNPRIVPPFAPSP